MGEINNTIAGYTNQAFGSNRFEQVLLLGRMIEKIISNKPEEKGK